MGTSPPQLILSGLPLSNPHVGLGAHTLRLVRGLAKAGTLSFRILLPREAAPPPMLLPRESIVWMEGRPPAWCQRPLLRDLYWMDRVAATARQEYPDAVFHSPAPFWSWRPQPRRTVVTLHDCIYRRFPRYLGRFFVRKWLASATERYAAQASAVITVSARSSRDLQNLAAIPKEKIIVLPNWIENRSGFTPENARLSAPAVRQRYRLPEHFWLYIGGYDYRKNVEVLIRACAQLKSASLPLVLAGKIPPFSPVHCAVRETIVACGLQPEKDVFLPGPIAEEDLPGLYGAADLLVYPSLYEGFGLPAIEAMAAGTPLLVSDSSSLPEVVTSPGNRFRPDDPMALAELLSRAAEDPGRFRLSLPVSFREENVIPSYIELIQRLAQ